MKRPVVVLTDPLIRDVVDAELRPHARVRLVRDPRRLPRALASADGLITVLTQPVTSGLLDHAPRLRVVGNMAVGVDNIDLVECARRKIAVVNTPDVLTRSTAELAVALLLAAARRFPEGEALCRAGKFRGWKPDHLLGLELKGRHAVLVGRGRIGKETGRLFRAIGLNVTYLTRADSPREIESKLKKAQILSLHVGLNPTTRHWLSSRRLALLPPDAIVINTSRGPVIDEKSLIRSLRERRIFAAGLDVFEHEPRIPKELRRLPNVVLLPHLGSATRETRAAMTRLVIRGALGILSGRRVPNTVRFKD